MNWVRMSIHSSVESLDDGFPAMIKKHGQDLAACLGYLVSKAQRKVNGKLHRMARPKFESGEDVAQGVQFVATTFAEDSASLIEEDSAPLLMAFSEDPKPSELAGLTMEALAKQLEGAGEDDLAARMLSNHSKCMAMGQMRSDQKVEYADVDCESETECV